LHSVADRHSKRGKGVRQALSLNGRETRTHGNDRLRLPYAAIWKL
jgi:hypothetical protein